MSKRFCPVVVYLMSMNIRLNSGTYIRINRGHIDYDYRVVYKFGKLLELENIYPFESIRLIDIDNSNIVENKERPQVNLCQYAVTPYFQ